MSSTQKPCLIDEILVDLDKCTQSMRTQSGAISDITYKSNNVLLQVEAANSQKPTPKTPNAVAYTCNKDMIHTLATIIDTFQKCVFNDCPENTQPSMITNKETFAGTGTDFEKFFLSSRQKVECLGGTVRKLLAINDTVVQMKANLEPVNVEEYDEEVLSE